MNDERMHHLRIARAKTPALEAEGDARLQQLVDLTDELARARLPRERLLHRIARRGAEMLRADAAAVLLVDEEGDLVVGAAFGHAASLFGDSAQTDTVSALAAARRSSEAVIVSEVGCTRVGMFVPMRTAWNVIGVLAVGRRADRPFASDDVSIARMLATHAAAAIENARLAQQARESDRRRDDFLARLAHELRNPLAPLVNALQVLGRLATTPDVARLQSIMAHQAGYLGALVDEMLDVARLRFDKLLLNMQAVDMRDVARRSFEALQLAPFAEGHDLAASLPDAPVIVDGDPIRLEQVVGNLLNNAVKYTPRGEPIRLVVDRTATDAIVTVWDHGIGIAADMLPRVFNVFTQAERSRHRAQGGLGLGLALVRALVERHGGTVSARSAGLGHGSEFTVRLPLSRPTERTDQHQALPRGL